jgi:hypothetical protein
VSSLHHDTADIVDVLECQTEAIQKMTVGQFFQMFKDRALRELHVDDWPKPSSTPMGGRSVAGTLSGPATAARAGAGRLLYVR